MEERKKIEKEQTENDTQEKDLTSVRQEVAELNEQVGLMYQKEESQFTNIHNLKSAYERIQIDKGWADETLIDLAHFKIEHADKLDENIRNGRIIISVEEKIERTEEEINKADREINILNTEIGKKEHNKPKYFGKKKWEKELAGLKGSLRGKEEEIERFREENDENDIFLGPFSESLDLLKHFGFSESKDKLEEILSQDGVKLSTLIDQLEGTLKDIKEKKLSPKDQEMVEKYLEITKHLEKK